MSHLFDMLRRQLWAVRWVALLLVPWIDGRLSGGHWLAFAYVPLLFLASPLFALTSVAMTPLYFLTFHPDYHRLPLADTGLLTVSLWDYFTLVQFGLVICLARDGLLWSTTPPDRLTGFILRRYGQAIRGLLLMASVGLVITLSFNATPVAETGAWALLLLYLRRQIPAERPAQLRMRAATAALFVLSLAVSVFIVEAGVRLFLKPSVPSSRMFESDPSYIFTLAPSVKDSRDLPVSRTGRRPISFEISPQGLRDRVYGPKEPGEFRILMLGDSFTMGWSCSLDHSIPRRLECHLDKAGLTKRVSIINGGVAGYGPWQERGFLKERGFALEPDLVVLQLFPANDIDNTLIREGRYLQAYDESMHDAVDSFRHGNLWQVRVTRWIFTHFHSVYLLHKNMGLDLRFVHVWNTNRFLPHCTVPEPPVNARRPFWLETDLDRWYPELEEGFRDMLLDIEGIYRDCRERGVDFLAFCVPTENSVNETLWAADMASLQGGPAYDHGKSVRLTESGMAAAKIPHFSIAARLIACPSLDSLYYRDDGHFTDEGNDRAARFIANTLMADYFSGKGLGTALPPAP